MSDTLTVYMSGDVWNGSPTASILVNGQSISGRLSVSAVHGADNTQAFTFTGNFGASPQVGIAFGDNAWGGSQAQSRNLYLDGFVYDGVPQLNVKQAFYYDQLQTYGLTSAQTPAGRVADFLNTMGVNTHLSYFDTTYGNSQLIASSLSYLGVTHVRDGVPIGSTLSEFQALASAGIKFDILMPETSSNALLPQQLAGLTPIAGAISSIEGPNEFNVSSNFAWNGQSGDVAALGYQQALWQGVQADPLLQGKPVFAASMGGVGVQAYQALGALTPFVSNGNMHVYYPGGQPPASTIQYALGLGTISAPGLSVAVTETSYATAPKLQGGVNGEVQARYGLDLLMDSVKSKTATVYFYELLDERRDPKQTDIQNHFGLFHYDGSPKLIAQGIHNLQAILADHGTNASSFQPGTLPYTITGLPASGDTLLLQASDGSYDLVVWAEPQIWNAAGMTKIAIRPRPVKVTLKTSSKVEVFDPLAGTSALSVHNNAKTLTVQLTDHPIVLQITPPTAMQAMADFPGIALCMMARAGLVHLKRRKRTSK